MDLMLNQIKLSMEAGLIIKVLIEKTPSGLKRANVCWHTQKVILIGGFSNNPSLRKILERRLRKLTRESGVCIELETVNDPEYL